MSFAEKNTYIPNLDQLDDRIYHLDEMIYQIGCIHDALEDMQRHFFKFTDHLKNLKEVIHATQ